MWNFREYLKNVHTCKNETMRVALSMKSIEGELLTGGMEIREHGRGISEVE